MGGSEDHIQYLNPNRERHVSRVSLSVKFGFSNMWHAVERRDVCDEEGQHKPGQWGWIWADYMMSLCRKSGWNPWLCQWLHTKQAQELWVLTEIMLTLRWKKLARVVITHSCCVSGTVCAHLFSLTTWYSPKLSNQYGKTSTSCLDGTAPLLRGSDSGNALRKCSLWGSGSSVSYKTTHFSCCLLRSSAFTEVSCPVKCVLLHCVLRGTEGTKIYILQT